MQSLVETLIARDKISREQAEADIAECKAEMLEAIDSGDFFEAEEIFAEWFGLEPDYMFEIL